jgi:membrane protein YdbS with pleckstrin-like domain
MTLRRPQHLVSKRAIPYWTAKAAFGWLVLLGIGSIILFTNEGLRTVRVPVLAAAGAIAVVHLIVMPQWRYRVHRWETTPEAVYTQSGWFSQERRIAPISRIQTVDSHIGPFEQLFSLANVTVTTASAAGPLHIHGLDKRTAHALVDELTRTTQATAGDAT